MSDTLRAVSLLLSLLLWSPTALHLLHSQVSVERAALTYAGALLLALAGCSLLARIVTAYAPDEEVADEPEPARRKEDAAT